MNHARLFAFAILALHWWTDWIGYVVIFNCGLAFLFYKYCLSIFMMRIIPKSARDLIVVEQVSSGDTPLLRTLGDLAFYSGISTYLALTGLTWSFAHAVVVFISGNIMMHEVLNFKLPVPGIQEPKPQILNTQDMDE